LILILTLILIPICSSVHRHESCTKSKKRMNSIRISIKIRIKMRKRMKTR